MPDSWDAIQDLADQVQVVRKDPLSQTLTSRTPGMADPVAAYAAKQLGSDPRALAGIAGAIPYRDPNRQSMAAAFWTTSPEADRIHEQLGHGSLGVAEQQGRVNQLDPVGRFVAGLQQGSDSPWGQAFGITGDEARAYGMEKAYPVAKAGGSPMEQALAGLGGGLGDFYFSRNRPAAYANRYAGFAKGGPVSGYSRDITYSPEAMRDAATLMRTTGAIAKPYWLARDATSALGTMMGLQ